MKILVTGGAGFIGSNFIRHILNKYPDYSIINFDKLTYAGNLENLKDLENNPNYKFIQGDICDFEAVEKAISLQPSVIVNFAAETHVDRSILYSQDFVKTDVLGTHTLLEAVKKHNIQRYIQISTDEVYGSIEKGAFTEESTLSPNSPYSSSKAGGDLLVRSYFKTFKLPVIITRSSNNYGPYQYPEKIIPLFITNLLENKKVPLYGDGKNVRDWLYVMDNCEGLDVVLHKGLEGEIYNIGGECEKPNIEIAQTILKILGLDEGMINYVKDRPGHDRRYALDCSKTKKLGWKPKAQFDQAISETIKWYQHNEAWWKKIKDKQADYKSFSSKWYKNLTP